MSRKMTVGAALALALLMVAMSIPLTMRYARSRQNKLIEDLPKLIEEFGALQEIQGKVADKYYKNPTEDSVNVGMVRGYIAGLKDPGSRYLSAVEYRNYMERLEGRSPELGIVLKYSPELFGLVIDQVKAGSTAAVSGLKPGDHITKAETGGAVLPSITAEMSQDDAAKAISDFYQETTVTADTASIAITITYKRDGLYQPPVNVMVGNSLSSVATEILPGWAAEGEAPLKSVGYIKIYHFFKNTAEQLEAAFNELLDQNVFSFILDVRNCSEGDLEYACRAIDLFAGVGEGVNAMATVHYKAGAPKLYPSDSKNNTSLAAEGIAVLIDGSTSGVAELFAYDLRAYNDKKVFLVGMPTKGVKTVQEHFELSTVGGAALLTVGTVTPYGVSEGQPWSVQPNAPTKAETDANIVYRISGAEQQRNGALFALYQRAGLKPNS
ncbi:MAG: S41 family peptidase [Oscillospiraceae bacterium]|nr:S41 family peptidase [Oscillospiraceae bacterium]